MASSCAVWMEVPYQRHGSQVEQGACSVSMEVPDGVENPILVVHQPIQPIAGAVGLRMGKGHLEPGGFVAQPDYLLAHGIDRDGAGPLPKPTNALRELSHQSRHGRRSIPCPQWI